MHLTPSFSFCLPIHWWWTWFKRSVFKGSVCVDIIWITRCDKDSGEQTTWIKQRFSQRYAYVECQLNSDQALRLLCLKGHVRARDSTLWRYRWQEATEFLCTKTPLLEEVQQPKKSPKTPGNALSNALLKWCFQNCAADTVKKKTALHAIFWNRVSRGFNELIDDCFYYL